MKTYTKTTTTDEPRLVIEYDNDAESPRQWDNIGVFVTKIRNYKSPDGNVGDEYLAMIATSELEPDNATEHARLIVDFLAMNDKKPKYIYPISLYEHSNVSYTLAGDGNTCQFDSGICGFYIVHENEETQDMTEDEIKDCIRGELKEYTNWCNGEVYEFTLYDNDGNIEDNGGGFYDINDIKEHLPDEWSDEDMSDYMQ